MPPLSPHSHSLRSSLEEDAREILRDVLGWSRDVIADQLAPSVGISCKLGWAPAAFVQILRTNWVNVNPEV